MKILEMNKEKVSGLLDFYCKIEYSTLVHQRITYVYQIKISNDNRIEIIEDSIQNVEDEDNLLNTKITVCRNLQDYISGVDRSNYYWEKMGRVQMRGIMTLYNTNIMKQDASTEEQSNIENNNSVADNSQ